MAPSKGASLDPSTHSKGGAIPDGDYVIKTAVADTFDYNGTQEPQPALLVLYADASDPSVTHEQAYTAGKMERLIPSDDKKRFVHPRGEAAVIAGGSNVSLFLGAILKAGFPVKLLQGDDVTVFAGTKVTVTNLAQPTRGLANEKAGKTIPLVTKVLALPGAKAVAGARPTAPAAAAASSPATSDAPSASNGAGDDVAIQAVMQALDAAPEKSLKVKGLAVRCLKFAPGTKLNDLTKLITPEWLIAQADATGWTTDGEVVAL